MTYLRSLPPAAAAVQRRVHERIEDITWLVETGENLTGAVRRLSTTRDALEHFCRRHNRPDLYAALSARELNDTPTNAPKNANRYRPVDRADRRTA